MAILGTLSDKNDLSETTKPNRVLLFLEPGSSALKKYPGTEEMIRYIHTLPSQEHNNLQEGITLSMRCADGVYECTLNSDTGDICITAVSPTAKSIQVQFDDEEFPGEEYLSIFLQQRLTKPYKLGTHLTLVFSNKSVSYQIGLIPSRIVEGVNNRITLLFL